MKPPFNPQKITRASLQQFRHVTDPPIVDTNKQVQIRVRDYGAGVPVHEENKLFKKFSTLSVRPTAGESSNGLGLSLVKRYMELMNGKVWFERPADGGAIFAIELGKA